MESFKLVDWMAELIMLVMKVSVHPSLSDVHVPFVDLSSETVPVDALLHAENQLMDILVMRIMLEPGLRTGLSPLEYLLQSFDAAERTLKESLPFTMHQKLRRAQAGEAELQTAVRHMSKALTTYSILAVLEPGTYGDDSPPPPVTIGGVQLSADHAQLLRALQAPRGSVIALPPTYVAAAVEHFKPSAGTTGQPDVAGLRAFWSPMIHAAVGLCTMSAPGRDDPTEDMDGATRARIAVEMSAAVSGVSTISMPATGGVIGQGASLSRMADWEAPLALLADLARYSELACLMTEGGPGPDACGWGHAVVLKPSPTGAEVERSTLLGRVLGLGPQRNDYVGAGLGVGIPGADGSAASTDVTIVTDLIQLLADLPPVGAEASGESEGEGEGGSLGDAGLATTGTQPSSASGPATPLTGVARLLRAHATPRPGSAGQAAERDRGQAIASACNAIGAKLRTAAAVHSSLCKKLVQELAKRGGGPKEAVFAWFGALLRANSRRKTSQFTGVIHTDGRAQFSSGALLNTATSVLVGLCEPFLDPTDPRSARIDPRFVADWAPNGNGGGRFECAGDDRMAESPVVDGRAEGVATVRANSWLDNKNVARQQQFMQRQAAIVALALASSGVGMGVSGGAGMTTQLHAPALYAATQPAPPRPTEPLVFSGITELFWLAIRAAHVGPRASAARGPQLSKMIREHKGRMTDAVRALRGLPGNGLDTRHPIPRLAHDTQLWYGSYARESHFVGRATEVEVLTDVWMADIRGAEALFRLYRLLAVLLVRCVDPSTARLVPGMCADWEHVSVAVGGGGGPATPSTPTTPAIHTVDSRSTPGKQGSGSACAAPPPPPVPGMSPLPPTQMGTPVNARRAGQVGAQSPAPSLPSAVSLLPLPSPLLPLPKLPHPLWCALPAHLLQDVAHFFIGVQRGPHREALLLNASSNIPLACLHDFLTFAVTFLSNSLYVFNPHTRGELGDMIHVFVPLKGEPWRISDPPGSLPGSYGVTRGPMPPVFTLMGSHGLALRHGLPGLIDFHTQIARSGLHAGAYDKYRYRSTIHDIMGWAWAALPTYRQSLITWAHDEEGGNTDKFCQFANDVLEDTDFFMQEALKNIEDIRSAELAQANSISWSSLSPAERAEAVGKARQSESEARYWLQEGNASIHFMALLTSGITHAWLSPRVRVYLANMLGFYLNNLVNPSKRGAFKVKAMDKIGFKPRVLLLELITVYNNLALPGPRVGAELADDERNPDEDILAAFIVKDERSFLIDNFSEAARVLSDGTALVPEAVAQVERLPRLIRRLTAAVASAGAEEDLGELPDDVCDPLCSDIMDDPVMLPASFTIVQRSIMQKQLLSEERDPFNRAYLTEAMLIELPTVKAAIASWVRARRAGASGEDELALVSRVREEAAAGQRRVMHAEKCALSPAPVVPAPVPHEAQADVQAQAEAESEEEELALAMALSMSVRSEVPAERETPIQEQPEEGEGEEVEDLAAAVAMSLQRQEELERSRE